MTEKTRRTTLMNATAGNFSFDGVTYSRDRLAVNVQSYLATLGLQQVISRAKDPIALYADLVAGKLKEPKDAGAEYTEWHRAAASAHALAEVKAAGIRAKPGKTLHETPEYADTYQAALRAMAPWSREKTNEARKHANVVEEHNRITGAPPPRLDALFGAPTPEEATDAITSQDEGAQAA